MNSYRNCSFTTGALVFSLILGLLVGTEVQANMGPHLFYDFVQGDGGAVLATLELPGLPATHDDVVSLTFTPEGMGIFGLGSPYMGAFELTNPVESEVVEKSPGLLGCTGCTTDTQFIDSTPPIGFEFILQFSNQDNGSEIRFSTDDTAQLVNAFGEWQLIPEPSSLLLWALASMGMLVSRRRSPWHYPSFGASYCPCQRYSVKERL